MALADRLESTPRRTTGLPCSVGAVEEHLTGKEADSFYAMLHTLGWSGSRVYKAVQDEAKELLSKPVEARTAEDVERASILAAMSEQQVNRHRSRSCRCFKAAA